MKRLVCILVVVYLSAGYAAALFAGTELDSSVRGSLAKLTAAYMKAQPAAFTKKGAVVLTFAESGEDAKSKGLGSTICDVTARQLLLSTVFFSVDRDSLKEQLREIELSQLGLIAEDKAVQAGRGSGAEVLISGSIAEIQDRFQVTIRLTETATGKVIAQDVFEINKKELIERKRQIAFEYIAQFGLGINVQCSYLLLNKSPTESSTVLTDVYMNYRPYLWLNFKLGVSSINTNFASMEGIEFEKVQRLMDPTWPGQISYMGGSINELTPLFGVDINWSPTEKFTIGLGLTYNMISNPVLHQSYLGLYSHDDTDDTIPYTPTNTWGGASSIEQTLDSLKIFRIELKPQYFISPRLTIGFYLAYLWSNKIQVKETKINNETISFPHTRGGENMYDAVYKKKYMGISPTILANGKNIEDFGYNGFLIGGSLNFYF